MGERRYLITVGVTAGLKQGKSQDAVRRSVDVIRETFTGLGYEATDVGGLDPAPKELQDRLRAFCAERESDDIVVLYHIGHASSTIGEHRLRMGGPGDDVHLNSIRTADIAAWMLDTTKLHRVLIVLETCQASLGVYDALGVAREIVKDRQHKGLVILSASHETEQVVPGDFALLFAKHVRLALEAGAELTPESVALAIQRDPAKPAWHTVTPSCLFLIERTPFFPAPDNGGGLDLDLGNLLTTQERSSLADILFALTVSPRGGQVVEIFQAAPEFLGSVPPGGSADLFSYVARLEQAWTQRGQVPPLLAFLEFLAARSASPDEQKLREFVLRVAHRCGVTDQALQKVAAAAAASSGSALAPVRVVVSVEQDVHSGNYTLTACLHLSPTGLPDKTQTAVPCTVDKLQRQGELLLDQAGAWLAEIDPGDLRAEFSLPMALIDQPVDEWRVGVGSPVETELGLHCIVLVRPSDCRRGWGSTFPKRWARLKFGPQHARVGWLHRMAAHANWDSEDIVLAGRTRMEIAAMLQQAGDVACVALSYAYQPGDEQSGRGMPDDVDGLRIALAAGVPVAIWRRDGGDVTPLRATLDEMAAQGTLFQLPAEVRNLRVAAAASASGGPPHLGRHLTLLWDAPADLPGSA